MFGMEKNKDDGPLPTVFEMEEAIKKNPHKRKELSQTVHKRMDDIKSCMKEYKDKKDQDQFAILLQGYQAIINVISRI